MAHRYSTIPLSRSPNAHRTDMVSLLAWKSVGCTVEKVTSKRSIGDSSSGGVISMVTPLELAVMC